ncbi:hypothetical protein [Dysgonomonas sp. 520]|uniref:hypothetical protein n=1 Tax=Dysgonomonas sp. 520 TaxID=2302931 RepID=UPI0013D63F73|nr:hypothetical protein [Dysgonomonas sp. 520]NDW08396.1 hypothetical protein [Dysgonomonas sp. 520]
MKKLLTTILFSIFFISVFAQNGDSYVYCELVGTGKFLSSKVNVQVDYGQETSYWKGVAYLKDENGKNKSFNSMVDAMNFMGKQGWEFVQAYVVTTNNQNVYHWLLKKSISENDLDKVTEDEK